MVLGRATPFAAFAAFFLAFLALPFFSSAACVQREPAEHLSKRCSPTLCEV